MQWNSSDIIAVVAVVAGLIGAIVPTIFNFILKKNELAHADQVEKTHVKLPAFSKFITLSTEMESRIYFNYEQIMQYLEVFYSVKMLIAAEHSLIINEYEKLLLEYKDILFAEFATDMAENFYSIQGNAITKKGVQDKLSTKKQRLFNSMQATWPKVADVLKSDLHL
jgi:phosphate/sulfate permease